MNNSALRESVEKTVLKIFRELPDHHYIGQKFRCNGHEYKVIGFDHGIPILEQLEVVEFT